MKKIISNLRDLKLIEKELAEKPAGTIAIQLDDDKIHQVATNFVYLDKNIYVFLKLDDDLYQQIKFDYFGSFTIHRFENRFKDHNLFAESTYKLFSITISGTVREVEDKKFIDQLIETYQKKYSPNIDLKKYRNEMNLKPIMIDTEEMQTFTEEGD